MFKGDAYNPKVVDEEEEIYHDTIDNDKLNKELEVIDKELVFQIINGPSTEARMTLDMKKLK